MKTLLRSAGIALLAMVVCAPNAGAETGKCQRAIAKASSQFLQARVKALSKCNEGVVKAGAGTCPDQKTTDSIAKAASKLEASIGKACGGSDKVCNGDFGDNTEDSPASVGWPSVCPNFEKGSCENAISDCSGIAACVECINGAASDQAINLYFGDINLQTADSTLNKCQSAIGKANSAFVNATSKALQKCWDARINGKHSNDCFPPSVGDGKYQAAIDKAKAKASATICKACGGPDKTCDGNGDLTPAAIGFASDCIYVVRPHDNEDCSGPISTLQDIVDCTACASQFKSHCMDDVTVPQYAPYPAVCNSCTLAPATGACPTSIEFNADGPNVVLDTGFTGLAHNAHVPSNNRLTLSVSGCSGVAEPTCGVCNVSGPIDNAGGITFDNQRCQDAPWKTCDVNADCTSATQCVGGANNGALCTTASQCPGGSCDPAGIAGPCIRYFGPPLPLRAGGVSTCVVNEISGPVSGTIDFGDGSTTSLIPLASRVNIAPGEFEPCPHCTAGLCTSGGRVGQACTVSGTSLEFGTVSLDCPPNNEVAKLILNLNVSTGTQVKTVEAGNPTCRQTGYTGLKCLCDTCNNVNQEGCSLNADCPANGGGAGICGGLRCIGGTEAGQPCRTCIGGTNHGAINCTSDSACPGGVCSNPRVCIGGANDGASCNNISACPGATACAECSGGGACNRPGEATQPNVCSGSGCVDVGNNKGECIDGPVDTVCSIQQFRTCTTNADCVCPECVPNQTCISRNRPCFVDNGVLGNTVSVAGAPDAPCGGVSNPTIGAFFCVAPTGAAAVNAAGGLPALGRVAIPGTVVVNP